MKNLLKQKLQEGKRVYGPWILTTGLDNAEILSHAGADLIMIDGEHGAMDLETAGKMVSLIRGTQTAPLLRVPWNTMTDVKRGIDTGAHGIMIPFINTKEEAEYAVSLCRFPPVGIRGQGSARAALFSAGLPPFNDYNKTANDEVLVIVQFEHIKAFDNLDEILSVDGIDVAFLGPRDLSLSMGLEGNMDHPDVQELCKKLAAACKKHNVFSAMLTWPGAMKKHYDFGFQMLVGGTDAGFISNGIQGMLKEKAEAQI